MPPASPKSSAEQPVSPPAVRLRRPGLRDPRLLTGVVLVAASVALGSAVVSGAARTVSVYAAAEPLVPGEPVTPGALVVREVRLGESTDRYLTADRPPADGLVTVRAVAAGELVPAGAVAPRTELGLRPVAITPEGVLPSGVVEGATVDLWYVPPAPGSSSWAVTGSTGAPAAGAPAGVPGDVVAPPPHELAHGLTVAEVSDPRGGLTVGSDVTVHVLVPVEELPDVLAALAEEGSVRVVLVPGA